jgi:hypothetical protein
MLSKSIAAEAAPTTKQKREARQQSPRRSSNAFCRRAFRPDALRHAIEKHRGCFQQPQGWSSRSYNEAETRDATMKPAPLFERSL